MTSLLATGTFDVRFGELILLSLPACSHPYLWLPRNKAGASGHALQCRLDGLAAACRRGGQDGGVGGPQHTAQRVGDVCQGHVHIQPVGAAVACSGCKALRVAGRALKLGMRNNGSQGFAAGGSSSGSRSTSSIEPAAAAAAALNQQQH